MLRIQRKYFENFLNENYIYLQITREREREREREKILSNFVYCKLIKIDLVSRKMMKF